MITAGLHHVIHNIVPLQNVMEITSGKILRNYKLVFNGQNVAWQFLKIYSLIPNFVVGISSEKV